MGDVYKWDICDYLHAMNDFGFADKEAIAAGKTGPSGYYSRPHTQGAECYAERDGKKCQRRGRCLIRVKQTQHN